MLTAIRHPSPGMSLLNSDWAVTPAMKFVHWVCEEVDQRFAGYSVYRAIRHRPRPLGLANANLLIAVCPELSPIRSEIHALVQPLSTFDADHRTSPAVFSTLRCCETAGRLTSMPLAISVTERVPSRRRLNTKRLCIEH